MKKKLLVPLFLAGMALPLVFQQQGVGVKGAYFVGEIGNKAEYIKHAEKVNGQMADEGFVLLKNRDNFLPVSNPEDMKVSICGKNSYNLVRGGAGSGAGSVSGGVTDINLQKSLTNVGFKINDALTKFYGDSSKSGSGRTEGNSSWTGVSQYTSGETPMSSYDADLLGTLDEYSDFALQVVSRQGSEGCDLKTCDYRDNNSAPYSHKHALELTDNEQALFEELKSHTDNIIFIINSSNIMECGELENDPAVAGIIWVGNPGDVGLGAVGRILTGEVNPSGRTVDTWARDFTKDPTFQNFSDNAQTNLAVNDNGKEEYMAQDTMFAADGAPMMSWGTYKSYKDHSQAPGVFKDKATKVMPGGINGVKASAYVSYEEGIYVDYRYYETRYAEMAKTDKDAADSWYAGEEGVVYPFGYGLSYTTFDQKIVRINPAKNTVLDANSDLIEISVKVTNTGDVAGKDAVQLYWNAPYKAGEIEKADKVLCAFDKTDIIQPGESQIMHLTMHLQDVANYDFSDANKNGFQGYELDDGTYNIIVGKNAHDVYDQVPLKVLDGGIQYKTDRFTGNEVKNRFTNRGFYNSMPEEGDLPFEQMSRADFEGTFPHNPGAGADKFADRTVGPDSRFEEFLTHEFNVAEVEVEGNYDYVPEAVKRTEQDAIDGGWEQKTPSPRTQLKDMKDYAYDDPKWDEFINEFSWSEMLTYVERNGMASPSMSSIGKGGSSEGDGPQKFNIMWWVSSPIVAATFNQKLAHDQGECIGMESQISGKAGWWGSAVNTHRSPFGGRNFEYYSADPFLMGRIAAQVVGTATDRGVYAYFKHFAVNDQEKNRESGISFVNEQALREIYLKSFQMVFEEGRSIGVMGSYNRLGLMETAASYPLMTEVLRGEWGFKGSVLSDMTHSGNGNVDFKCYECVTNRCFAGTNCQLDSNGFSGQTEAKWDSTAFGGKGAPTITYKGEKVVCWSWWNAVRQAVKQHMYMCCNSTAVQRGMTMVVDSKVEQINVGEEFSYTIEVPEKGKVWSSSGNGTVTEKDIDSVSRIKLHDRAILPAGVTFDEETGTLAGKIDYVGYFYIDVIAEVAYTDGTTGAIAFKFEIETLPDMTNTGLDGDDPVKPSNGGAGLPVGAIAGIAGGAVVAIAAVAAVVIILGKKKKIA